MSDVPSAARRAVADAVVLATAGRDAFGAAHEVAQRLPRAVLAFLAEAALVDQIRTAQRKDGLAVERDAERRPRRGTRAYGEWVTNTPVGATHHAELLESERRRDSAILGAIQVALKDYEARLRVEWTSELLHSTFALPDGSLVTWGQATVEQHRVRRAMFLANAHGNLEGAARHSVAIRELESSGADSLEQFCATKTVA